MRRRPALGDDVLVADAASVGIAITWTALTATTTAVRRARVPLHKRSYLLKKLGSDQWADVLMVLIVGA
ncbi:hypothetical protein AB4Z24_22035 [Hyphomicrobium sp. 2TAF46]